MGKKASSWDRQRDESLLSRLFSGMYTFIKYAEFEIFFVFFCIIAFFLFKDLTARPEDNQILVKKPAGLDFLPY